MDDHLIRVVAEYHILEIHPAFGEFQVNRILRKLFLLLFLKEFKNTLRRGRCGLQHVGYLRQLGNRLGKVSYVLDKRLDITYRNGSPHGQDASQNRHGYVAQISHKGHDGLHQAGKELGFPCGLEQNIIGIMEGLFHILFLVIRFHDIVATVNLFHLAVDFAQISLLRHEELLRFFYHNPNQACGNGQDDYGNQSHQGTDAQHHDQDADHGCDGGNQLCDALVQALPQRIHIVGNTGKDLAYRSALKIFHGHTVDFFTDFLPEAVGQLLGNARHNQPLYKGEHRAEHVQSQQKQEDMPYPFEINAAGAGNLGNQAVEKLCGGFPRNLGADDAEYGTAHRKNKHCHKGRPVTAHIFHQFFYGAFKILGLFTAHPGARAMHSGGSSLCFTHDALPPFSSASDSWERAIS